MSETTLSPTPEAMNQAHFPWGTVEISDAAAERMGLMFVDELKRPEPDMTHPPITIRFVTADELRQDGDAVHYGDVPIEDQNPFAVVSVQPDNDNKQGQIHGWSFDAVIGERPIQVAQQGSMYDRQAVLKFMQAQLAKQLSPALSELLGEQVVTNAITSERVWMRGLLATWGVLGSVAVFGSALEHDSAHWATGAVSVMALTGLAKLYHSGRLLRGFAQRVQNATPTAHSVARRIARDFGKSYQIELPEPGESVTGAED